MLASRQFTLKPLIESKDGIHLTAYLINRNDLVDLKSQINNVITEAREWLSTVLSIDEQEKFLEPLESLLQDARVFKQMKGNIGIFRNEEFFHILSIPIDIEQTCQVATSFHVKPLLRWLQGDQEFLLLGLEKHAAYLYLGSQDSLSLVESIELPELFKTQETENFSGLNQRISELTKNSRLKLFIAGKPLLTEPFSRSLNYKNVIRSPASETFNHRTASESCLSIRKILKAESKILLEKNLLEFKIAENSNRAEKNIFQISKAVVQGKVRKLIVTDELSIFGKIDHKSGGLAIHPVDLDHEDDCILDDLAQMVLSQGGEVIVAKRNEIPKGRPILALLDDDSKLLEKIAELQYEALEERFG